MAAASKKRFFPGQRSRTLALAAVASLSTVVLGCGNNGKPYQGPHGFAGTGGSAGDGGSGGSGAAAACPENATRDCHVNLGEHDNVHSCFDGVQTCQDGQWSPCTFPSAPPPVPPPGSRKPQDPHILSLSMPTSCNSDCDPSCQTFEETPATPIESPPENLIAQWQSGGYGQLPATIQSKGSAEPCGQGGDCAFDQYCSNPTSGTCAHHKCVPGAGLSASCDPCVASICAVDSTCCSTPYLGDLNACAHDLCATGAALVKTCDLACVNTKVCSLPAYAYCCDTTNGAWNADCVNKAVSLCSLSCTTGSWTQSCADKVDSVCGTACLKDTVAPSCAHDKCYVGAALNSACDPCVAQVCAMDAFCCMAGGAWNGQCVQEVATVCGETCPAKGDCAPWLPSQVDAGCPSKFDLTAGVGCTTAGVPQVPICNRGNSTAPAGLPIVALPAAASLPAAKCGPSLAGGTTYTTPSAIAPGKCVDVAMPALVDGGLIVANPSTAPVGYNSSECHCENNWSVYSTAVGSCATPSCAGASAFAKLKKVKMFINIDRSTSQIYQLSGLPGMPRRWDQLIGALDAFTKDAGSADLGIWMRMWPYDDPDPAVGRCPGAALSQCNPNTGCTKADKGTLGYADVADLKTGMNLPIITQFLSDAKALAPSGNTPMFPALEGSLIAAKNFKLNAANAGIEPVVLMVTDGEPLSNCDNNVDDIAAMAGTYFNAYGIRTYVIGIAEVTQLTVNKIAGAGGGRGFFIQNGMNVQVQQEMVTALGQIKQDFVSCTLDLPNQQIFDPTKATLTYTPGMGAAMTVAQVANAAACAGNGWYYDDPANPASMTLCPTTCTAVKSDVSGKLELKIDCILQYQARTEKQVYAADCPKGTVPRWGYLTYDTVTPGDSSVSFSVHTSDVSNSFPAATVLAATAHSTPTNTQLCAIGGPAPCPIPLFTKLGDSPDSHRKYLELVMDLKPTTDQKITPEINNWQITYSCVDAE